MHCSDFDSDKLVLSISLTSIPHFQSSDKIMLVFTASSFAMGNTVSTRQKEWLRATEKRINFTTSILGSIRNVKFLGLADIMSSKIEALRVDELEVSKKFRRIQSIRVCMGACLHSPLS